MKYLILLIIIGPISYCTYNYVSVENRVKRLCSEIRIGSNYSELKSFAKDKGLGPMPEKEREKLYLVESKTFGRWGCEVTMESGTVKSVDFNYSD